MKPTNVSLTLLAIVGLLLLALLPGCESGHGSFHSNLPPHVSVTGGPPQGGESYYYVTISWVGWDEDGTVKYFLYALDDTSHWTEIRQLEQTFLFTADSLRGGEEFGRWHTFWVKAVDNDGAKSSPDYLTFDARTVAPKTTITSPCDATQELCSGAFPVGTTVRFTWTGEDPDCSCPDKKPVAYQWRLVSVSGLLKGATPSEAPAFLENVMANTPENQPDTSSHWSEFSPDTEVVLTDLPPAVFYEFAVRAVDEAGAIEQGHSGFNQLLFKVMPDFNFPTLCLHDGASVCCTPPNAGGVCRRQVAPGQSFTLTWEGDASSYGGTIVGYRYGIDIQDLYDPSQWATDWGLQLTSTTLMFEEPGIHYFWVQVKDNAEAVTTLAYEVDVVPLQPDRVVLYVDDFYDITPTDAVHDSFTQAILTRCRYYTDSVYVFNCWPPGPGGVPPEMPMIVDVPPPSELFRYRFVIWDTDATQNTFSTGLSGVIASGALEAFLNAGGRLWIYGREIVRGSDPSPLSFSYGTVPSANSFAFEFLRISGVVNRPIITQSTLGNGFRRGLPNRRVSDLLPTLEIDYSKGGTSTTYGMSRVEAITFVKDTGLPAPDTLFFYGANSAASSYQDKACGLRYLDAFTGSKVVYLGFPMHYFFESSAESLATFVTDWMLGDAALGPRSAARR